MAFFFWLLSATGFILSLASFLFLCGCIYLVYIHNRYSHMPGPPRSSFFFGNYPEVKAYYKAGKIYSEYLLDKYTEFGPIYVLFLAYKPVVIITDPLYIKHVFIDSNVTVPKDKKVYGKLGFIYGQRALGYGLVTNRNNSSWLQRRQTINQAFHRHNLKQFMTQINEVTDKLLSRLTSFARESKEVRMLDELAKTTLHAIAHVAFGIDLEAIGKEGSLLRPALIRMLEGMEENFRIPLPSWLLQIYKYKFLQSDKKRSQIEGAKSVRDFARKCISERMIEVQRKGVAESNDILSYIMKCAEKDNTMTMEDLIDEFVTMFFAGHETTASSLAFTLYEVINNPEIEQKIVETVQDVVGEKDRVDYDHLPQLQFVERCIMEGLRKFMVVSGPTGRTLTEDLLVGGVNVPAGCSITANKFALNRSPLFWDNPKLFDPNRFSCPEVIPNFHYVYFPFSLGPRNCVGRKFAMFEQKVVLARLIQKFKFRLVPGQTSQLEEKITHTVKDGVVCTLELR